MSDIYDNLQQSMSKLSFQLSKFDTGYGLSVEKFALTEFIEDYISKNKNPQFEFVYDPSKHRMYELVPENVDDVFEGKATEIIWVELDGDPKEYV